jgi:GAF domain-containing protein
VRVTSAAPRERLSATADHEARALRALARGLRRLPARPSPDASLDLVVEIARELVGARYGALAVTDEGDRTIGFYTAGLPPELLRGLRTPPQGHGPLGSLRADGRPVRIDDVSEHARAFGFPPRHPAMRSLLGMPLWSGGSVCGALYVTDREDGRAFDEDDERLLWPLATHAGHVIERDWY